MASRGLPSPPLAIMATLHIFWLKQVPVDGVVETGEYTEGVEWVKIDRRKATISMCLS